MKNLIDTLAAYYGPQKWWPADTDFEIIVGAILTQNTAWRNVELAISNLKKARKLNLESILDTKDSELEKLIRPAGFFRQKTKKLKLICQYLRDDFKGDFFRFRQTKTNTLRHGLINIWGIGPETADSILLYVAHKQVFVVDAYMKRVLSRHGFCDENIKYAQLQNLAHSVLPNDVKYFQEAHALLVSVCKDFCKKNKPDCDNCPLGEYLN